MERGLPPRWTYKRQGSSRGGKGPGASMVFLGGRNRAAWGEDTVSPWPLSISWMLTAVRNPPIGKLLKAFIGDGPFCSSGVVWGMTFSRKDFMAGWWSGCCWDGGVCCFTKRLGSSCRDCCIICCCTLRGRPWKQRDDWETWWTERLPR